MAFTLPDLPYAHDALEPHIDARTMEIHHGKHHKTSVANLNAAPAKHHVFMAGDDIVDLMRRCDEVLEHTKTAVRNNGGGRANHSLLWQVMVSGGGGAPTGVIADEINST